MSNRFNLINDFVCSSIRRIRIEKGLRIQDIALRAGIPLGSYSCLETGRYRMSLENLFRVLHVLGTDIRSVWPGMISEPVEMVDDEFVEEAIREAEACRTQLTTIEDVVEAVCRAYDIEDTKLRSPSRQRTLAEARTVAAKLARDTSHLSLVALAGALNRDVSSLSHCLKRLNSRLLYDRRVSRHYRKARRLLLRRQKALEAQALRRRRR